MKTSTRPPMSSAHSHPHRSCHSQTNAQSFRSNRSTTPMASPRLPHSVGQPYPPSSKLSPAFPTDVRSSSPNYFGLNVEPNPDPRDSAKLPQENWSPPTSSIKSFGAAMPKQLPLDANPEFEAFRRQADANRGMSFALGSSHFASPSMQPPPPGLRPRPLRRPTNQSDSTSDMAGSRPSLLRRDTNGSRMDIDVDSLHDSAYVSSDSKRNSEASINPPSFFDMPRHESPAHTDSPFHLMKRSNLSQVEGVHPRLSLPQNKLDRSGGDTDKPRSETLPSSLEAGTPGLIMPAQLKAMIQNMDESEYLLLDVRVSTHYAQSRIQGALNLCIPTTLLKRATFDLQKLQTTLQTEEDQDKFAQWRTVKHLIVYDGASSEKRDAHSAMNMFKKFANEGYEGNTYLLRGGFNAFASSQAGLVDRRNAAERAGKPATSDPGRPTFAPVIGGVMLPASGNGANPFFGNIRQNMDLADGVGQMDIALPANLSPNSLPQWLRSASTTADHGKAVSEKFLQIERNEQARMRDAYSDFNSTVSQKPGMGKVSLSGVEKGGKNRYKDILPFDHARVHLTGRPEGACDYINASHIRSSKSNKRYIASQGPLPATFDDFWSVIWDEDVRVIVMLTAETEGGQLKCHPYWQNKKFGSIKLKPLSEKKVSLDIDKHRTASQATPSSGASSSPDSRRRRANTTTTLESFGPTPQPPQSQAEAPYVIIRKFALSHAAHPFAPIREITQLHYPSWPDFGAPAQPSHLLALVELSNVMQRAALPVDSNAITAAVSSERPATLNWVDEPEESARARPMLVHCSAGCGRTGTFCTVDSVIDMLKRQRMASLTASKSHDGDGDVSMDDEAISPCTKVPNSLKDNLNATRVFQPLVVEKDKKNLDVSWVGNDALDLIEKTVEEFRGQRLSMVQSLRQFVLCYEIVLEWVGRSQERSRGTSAKRSRARSGSLEAPSRR
ncbi:protein-tyrosine phosphatase [Pseudomassariella vexata]|uniref:protein-tyrosine-phosphatase n=1 Tax=Pseudomassariella vexata TaxID=1141098 RepID=A0A1Y2DY60_9PEZI|nr:protein-tyrosine phosphatase [Pseudomassariella vexata]ORY64149.1 protein-tyrosine phosphatase [Pseudomassariella vexata]